jgi:tRNA nucleotidyltransferase/poly(A) polymerase
MNEQQKARAIVQRLEKAGYEAYVIGGCVRDSLMGLCPKDIDLVTSATPEQVGEIFPEANTVGNCFLVSLVDGLEVATYRKDRLDCAEVAHTLEEDVSRRDFTINGIAQSSSGEIVDLVGGQEDIKNRELRFIGDPILRIQEDPVRILRGLRFAAKYNLSIETETYCAIFCNRQSIKDIPSERICKEIEKAFTSGHAYEFVRLLDEFEILEFIFPSIYALRGIDGGGYHNESVFAHCLSSLKALDNTKLPFEVKLGALYHDVGKFNPELNDKGFNTFMSHNKLGLDRITADLKDNLKFSNKIVQYVRDLSFMHMREVGSKKTVRKLNSALMECGIPLKHWIYIRYADNKGNMSTPHDFIMARRLYRHCLEALKEQYTVSVKDLKTDGNEIMNCFKLPPGPVVGVLLKLAFQAVQDELIQNEKFEVLGFMERLLVGDSLFLQDEFDERVQIFMHTEEPQGVKEYQKSFELKA